ncbi:MAG TPA: hypothetical protein VMY37_08930 [Thermoguttaceae bacterium]|nr:hypothetical protein [Thermoguttaceae bacterium]
MTWSEQTRQALHRWLAPDTWHKRHPLDDARFSVFVASVWNDVHSLWDEAETREKIAREAIELHPECDDLAKKVAETRVSEGTAILDFLCHLRDHGQMGLLSP